MYRNVTLRRLSLILTLVFASAAWGDKISSDHRLESPQFNVDIPIGAGVDTSAYGASSKESTGSLYRIRVIDDGASENGRTSNEQAAAQNPIQINGDLPSLSVDTVGPSALVVGRASEYKVTVANRSDFEAKNTLVRVQIPDWVRLDDSRTTVGEISKMPSGANQQTLEWNVDQISPNDSQELALMLVPTVGRGFELNVDFSAQPKKANTMIVVNEPKLRVHVNADSSVVAGNDMSWNLVVENPGTSEATNVRVDVVEESKTVASQMLRAIAAGSEAKLQIARPTISSGNVEVTFVASADLGITSKVAHKLRIRQASLYVQAIASKFEFAGAKMPVGITVTNNGDAVAQGVVADVDMPERASYLGGIEGAIVDGSKLSWVVGDLKPSESREYNINVELNRHGMNQTQVSVATADDLMAKTSAATEAYAIADLRLRVVDPKTPQIMGRETEIEIHVTNHGTSSAHNIELIAACPPELMLVDVNGSAAVKSGQIFFRPIRELPAKHRLVRKVKVKATASGNHNFRVVVKCEKPETRLAVEESTRFFELSDINGKNVRQAKKESR